MTTIKNLTGEDFYECTLCVYDSNGCTDYSNTKQLGDFMMGESRTVKYCGGRQWCIIGYSRYGDQICTRLKSSIFTTFYKKDVIY